MLKIEAKVKSWAEEHILILSLIFVSVLALYLRKIAVWWSYPNVGLAFDAHTHHVESSLYYVLVSWAQYIPLLPLHTIKWFTVLADFIIAMQCAVISAGGISRKWNIKEVIIYTTMLFSPVLFMRGITWGSIDSVAVMCILFAYLLMGYKKEKCALIMVVLATGFYPGIVLLVVLYLFVTKHKKAFVYSLTVLLGMTVLLGVCGVYLGKSFFYGVATAYNWSTYHFLTGEELKNIQEWLQHMLVYLGLPVSVFAIMMAIKHKISYTCVIAIQVIVSCIYGSVLFG